MNFNFSMNANTCESFLQLKLFCILAKVFKNFTRLLSSSYICKYYEPAYVTTFHHNNIGEVCKIAYSSQYLGGSKLKTGCKWYLFL